MRFLLSVLLLCFVTFNGGVPECNELENGATVANSSESNVDSGITSTIVTEADDDQRVVQPQEVCVSYENMIHSDMVERNEYILCDNFEIKYVFSDYKMYGVCNGIIQTVITTEYRNQLGPIHRWVMA